VFWSVFKMTYVQPHHEKGLGESLILMWLNIGLSLKMTNIRTTTVLVSYPKHVLFLALSFSYIIASLGIW